MESLEQKQILIIEDEPLIANHIELILNESDYNVVQKVRSANEAIRILDKEKPDLILLDISIKGDTDGVELAYIINEKYKVPFIYLTSHYDESTVNRLKKTQPAGFVLKPFNEKELLTQISIALYNTDKIKIVECAGNNYIFVRYNNQWIKIPYGNICFAKADDNYTIIHTPEKEYLLSYPLKKIEDNFPKNKFFRVHKSFLVNLERIESISERIIIIKHHQIPIGRIYYDSLMDTINKL
jgi:DNA-binding LytR/AlgR family response regulator